jgi:hypothetical protein
MENWEKFVKEKMFNEGSRLMSGKFIKYLLGKHLIWSQYDSDYTRKSWLENLVDDRYYIVRKETAVFEDGSSNTEDYWFSVVRFFRRDRPDEMQELKELCRSWGHTREHRKPRYHAV